MRLALLVWCIVAAILQGASACTLQSTLVGYTCMQTINNVVSLHWNVAGGEYAARFESAGWVAVGFPDTPGVMGPASALIAVEGTLDKYTIGSTKVPSAVVKAGWTLSAVTNHAYVLSSTVQVITWKGIPGVIVDLNYAYSSGTTLSSAHTGKGNIRVTPCTASDLTPYTCMETLTAVAAKYWRVGGTDLAVRFRTSGWVSISFPSTPTRMVPASAYIIQSDAGAKYSVAGRSSSAITQSSWADSSVSISSISSTSVNNVHTIAWQGEGIMDINFASGGSFTTHSSRGSTKVGSAASAQSAVTPATLAPGVLPTMAPSTPAPSTPAPVTSTPSQNKNCTASTLPGYDCMTNVTMQISTHWEVATRNIAVVFDRVGWAGVSWPDSKGSMGPARAMLVTSSGANSYRIGGGKTLSNVVQEAGAVAGVTYETVQDAKILKWQGTAAVVDFNYACHLSSTALGLHQLRAAVTVDTATGGVTVDSSSNQSKVKMHGTMMVVLWSVMAPMAVLMKRYGVFWGITATWRLYPVPFLVHATVLFLVMVLSTVSVCLALVDFGDTDKGHKPLGIIILTLSVLQVVMNVCRPGHTEGTRKYFNIAHRCAGITCYVASIAQIFIGIDNYKRLYNDEDHANSLQIVTIVFVVATFLIGVVSSVIQMARGAASVSPQHAVDRELSGK